MLGSAVAMPTSGGSASFGAGAPLPAAIVFRSSADCPACDRSSLICRPRGEHLVFRSDEPSALESGLSPRRNNVGPNPRRPRDRRDVKPRANSLPPGVDAGANPSPGMMKIVRMLRFFDPLHVSAILSLSRRTAIRFSCCDSPLRAS